MTTVTGTVEKIDSRVVKTKFGPKPAYDVYVAGRKYGWGFKNPALVGLQAGVNVEFETNNNGGYSNAEPDTLKVLSGGGGSVNQGTSGSRTATSNNRSSMGFPVDTTSDKFAIIRQNALTNAVAAVSSYHQHMDHPDISLEEYADLILKVAYTFTDFSSGQREVKAARKLQKNHPKAIESDLNAAVSHLISDEIEANNANTEDD